MARVSRGGYPIVSFRYVDSSIRDKQTMIQEEHKPQVSEVAGFLVRDLPDRIEVVREVFREGNYTEVRGSLCIPRCTLVGKVRRHG